MGTQSALFSPSKYGILPELLPKERLVWGNGILQMTTFMAIVLGTVFGSMLSEQFQNQLHRGGLPLVFLAVAGLGFASCIRKTPIADSSKPIAINPLPFLIKQLGMLFEVKALRFAVIGVSYFWLLGVVMQMTVLMYGKKTLLLTDSQVGWLLAALAIGIGAGSIITGFVVKQATDFRASILGVVVLAATSFALSVTGLSMGLVMGLFFVLGFGGGMLIVPLNAALQQESPPKLRGSLIASTNVLTSMSMLIGSGVFSLLSGTLKLAAPQICLATSLISLAALGVLTVLKKLPG